MQRMTATACPWACLALTSAFLAAGCGDALGLGEAQTGDDPGVHPATSAVRVALRRAAAPDLGASSAVPTALEAESAALIDLENVLALTVLVVRVEVLPVGTDEDTQGGWVSLDLAEAVPLDFLALPFEGESPLVIAAGELAAGDYAMLRLFVQEATIVFDQPFTVGMVTYEGEHPVVIPSGDETGIKTDVAFTVATTGDGEPLDVGILFDAEATIQAADATGDGTVILAPVLRAGPAGGE